VYSSEALDVLAFVRQAQRLGFTLEEIKEIASIQRSGRLPCPHVHGLVQRKRADLDGRLADLTEMRSAWTRFSDAGGRGATRRPCVSTSSSRTRGPHPSDNGRNEEGGMHDPSCVLDADAGRRCRGVRGDGADTRRLCVSADT
jgi:DNA-binding transcriptional MerR regulator